MGRLQGGPTGEPGSLPRGHRLGHLRQSGHELPRGATLGSARWSAKRHFPSPVLPTATWDSEQGTAEIVSCWHECEAKALAKNAPLDILPAVSDNQQACPVSAFNVERASCIMQDQIAAWTAQQRRLWSRAPAPHCNLSVNLVDHWTTVRSESDSFAKQLSLRKTCRDDSLCQA